MTLIKRKLVQLCGTRNYQKFIVLSRSRTGSNLLISLLNSHPNIQVSGEVFVRLDGQDYQTILARQFARQPWNIDARGFKLFYYHPVDNPQCGLWETLQQMPQLKVIHLTRKNTLQIMVSRKIAVLSNEWQASHQTPTSSNKTLTLTFTAEELIKGFERTERWQAAGDEWFANHDVLQVDYDSLVNEQQRTFTAMSEFLGVAPTIPNTSLTKQNARPLSEVIENYAQLQQEFAATRWARFFNS